MTEPRSLGCPVGAEAILPVMPLPEAERRGRNSLDSPLLLSFMFLPMPPTGRSQWAHVPGRYINSLQCWASEAQSNGVGVGGIGKDGSEGEAGNHWPTNSGTGPDGERETK